MVGFSLFRPTAGCSMFDHVGFLVHDSGISLPFYEACLAPLGILKLQAMPQFDAALFKDPNRPGFLFVAGNRTGVPSYWTSSNSPGAAPIHLAFAALDQAAVKAFHAAALAHGGRDNGSPGFRDQGMRKEANFVAFVLDPDNNNVEASWPNPDAVG